MENYKKVSDKVLLSLETLKQDFLELKRRHDEEKDLTKEEANETAGN